MAQPELTQRSALLEETEEAISQASSALAAAAGSSWRWALATVTTRLASFFAP